ncbi:hypothetical protein TPHA_0F01870 [Tetrapisispora phaffii CBS 4417]|uniref:Cytochrome c oxidase-assembly factor COX23, mitochondrial n=1 Tax=Tetrapisispora phaffii (strain ATCC 24235 / CBS 4417 / NBRC 1672 / NRRL Y-8282 / UCD 70-5) TaxID=1071381 RepID=G8BV87_TETPH|nr:hypothetical protein TPHA_0F01870 [Tetrapisispora phaffii CBS 4417]CCE63669.1 hypothetical protein TPHA_0F01870 [Tetrapisispora phaffii CBS 4417]
MYVVTDKWINNASTLPFLPIESISAFSNITIRLKQRSFHHIRLHSASINTNQYLATMSDDNHISNNNNGSNDITKDSYDPSLVTNKESVDFTKPDITLNENRFKFYPDNPESSFAKYRFMSKDSSQYYDPCDESAKMSFKCLDMNDYDRDKCRAYFDAYRECKKQWLRARRNNEDGNWGI